MGAQIQAAITTVERSSFARLVQRLTELATRILVAAELPSGSEQAYVVRPDGTWAVLDEAVDLNAEQDSVLLPLDQALLHLGHAPDSPEGYAARVLRILSVAQEQLRAGSMDEAMASAFAAGELVTEAAMKGMFEVDFLTGERVREGGRQGHRRAHGSEEDKAARRANYIRAFDLAVMHGFGRMEAYRSVAKVFGVSPVTVRRAIAQRGDHG
ncbi:hypothetical protein Rumeso_02473 [Rubellimicrobium mesophilum DSM 19309]|uniref:Uncharacterized protein n=1 Tax=Rubellimicrobium mesophilum DSM 19309 TaxID=442562 RepID=A0A017HQP4_9RHOB|nr:hypothetical protein Rumeso_02473 [Rubellimicrobium mesophilum DSM 19309]